MTLEMKPEKNGEEVRAESLARGFLRGDLSRRDFLRRAGGFSAAALASTSLGAVLAACSKKKSTPPASTGTSGSTGAGGIKPGGTLQAALTGEPDTLDPATSTIYTGAQVYDNIFSKLIDIDTDGSLVGVLATDWSATDEKTWVFNLVDNATFHNGEAFTADDVKYTFERILDPNTASSYSPLYDAIKTVEAASPTQVIFHLKSPFGPFLSNLANNGEIVNQKAVEAADPARNPVGTGPFKFVEWVQGDHITLEKFDGYFKEGKPYLDGIEFKFLLVDQGRLDGLSSGELNWVDAVPLQSLSSLSTDPSFTYVTSATAGIPDFLALNTTKAPFDNKLVRQAVYWALDRTQIRDVAYSGAGEVGIEEVPTGSTWFDGASPVTPDIDKANGLMVQAGFPDGLEVEFLGLPQYPELLKTGEVVREQLKQIGITMNIKQVDVSVWFNAFIKGNYQITSAYQERTIDPDNFYSLVLRTGGAINTTFYSNPAADALIDQARVETDDATRSGLYQQLRQIIFDDVPLIFAHYETINYLMNPNVTGSTVNSTLELRLENVGFTA
ncbi:MAG: ABC transporter substrate-binding protein [Actinomycetota bacterium]